MSLLDIIVKTGIANAIATQFGGLKGDRNAIAETIENNVRKKIIKENLNDPAFYDKMSALLDEIIAARRAKAIEYEEYLKRIAELIKKVDAGKSEDTPVTLDSPGKRAIYNNLMNETPAAPGGSVREPPGAYGERSLTQVLDLALRIDVAIKKSRPDAWRGVQAREQIIKRVLFDVLRNEREVERIFLIVKAQSEY